MTYTIHNNENFGSLEISFPTMPTPAIRNELKNRRFRWHSARRIWYGYADENELRAALDKLIARADKIAAANRERRRFGGAELHESAQSSDIGTNKADPVPENKFPSAAELPRNLAFTYRIGNSVGQANLSTDFLFRANAATMKTVLSMVDGIEDETERKNAYFHLVCVAYYNAAENPGTKSRLRSISALYEAKFGKLDLPEEETENALPVASKTVTAAMKRIYSAFQDKDYSKGIYSADDLKIATNGNMMVCLRSTSLDLPENPNDSAALLNCCRHWMEGAENRPTISLPTVRELKAWIKTQPVEVTRSNAHRHHYNLAENVWVNPFYLLDIMEALPGATVYAAAEKYGALTFQSADGFGILMPVHHVETETERKSA